MISSVWEAEAEGLGEAAITPLKVRLGAEAEEAVKQRPLQVSQSPVDKHLRVQSAPGEADLLKEKLVGPEVHLPLSGAGQHCVPLLAVQAVRHGVPADQEDQEEAPEVSVARQPETEAQMGGTGEAAVIILAAQGKAPPREHGHLQAGPFTQAQALEEEATVTEQ